MTVLALYNSKRSSHNCYKYKNEVGCRNDTVPKTVDTRMPCTVESRVCNNLPQPPKPRCREGVAYCAVCSCVTCLWHGVIPTSYFIFILVELVFLCTTLGSHCTRLSTRPSFLSGATLYRDLEAAFFISGDSS